MNLDKRDLKTLAILGENPRIPYSELAKKLGISKNAAKYRLDKLFEEDIIRGTHPVINYAKLGYFSCHLFLKVRNRQESRFKEYLQQHPYVMWAVMLFGNWDYLVELLYRNSQELEKSITEITELFGENFESCKTNITAGLLKQQPHIGALYKETLLAPQFVKEGGETITLDPTEKKILYELSKNGRITYQELGNKTGLSLQTAKNYFQRLQKKNVLLYFIPQYNYTSLGYRNYIMMISLYKVTPEKRKALHQSLLSNESVILAIKIANFPELFLLVRVKTTEEFETFAKQIYDQHCDVIRNIEFMHTIETLKVDFFPKGLR